MGGMKTFHRVFTGIVLLALTASLVSAQQKPEAKPDPAHKMVEFHMALLKHGPKWTAEKNSGNSSAARSAHGVCEVAARVIV